MARVFAIVLAGGEGKRLAPLTLDRAKPAVPFGGNYRLIDFALSNLVNAGYLRIVVLTQYKSHSLDRHVALDVAAVAAARQLRHAGAGADAARATLVRRLGRRDLPELQPARRRAARLRDRLRRRPHLPDGPAPDGRAAHRERRGRDGRGACACRSRRRTSSASIETGGGRQPKIARSARSRRTRRAARRPRPGLRVDGQLRLQRRRAPGRRRARRRRSGSNHDVGGNIIPMLVERGEAQVYDFSENEVPGATPRDRGYWRDVGTLDASTRRTWTSSRSTRCSTSTTATGRS